MQQTLSEQMFFSKGVNVKEVKRKLVKDIKEIKKRYCIQMHVERMVSTKGGAFIELEYAPNKNRITVLSVVKDIKDIPRLFGKKEKTIKMYFGVKAEITTMDYLHFGEAILVAINIRIHD